MSDETVDFTDLLNASMDEIKERPLMPRGLYSAVITKREFVKSRQKQTPGVEFTFSNLEPTGNVAEDEWKEFEQEYSAFDPEGRPGGRDFRYTFWLTPNARIMFKNFVKNTDVDPEGKQIGEVIEELLGETVGVYVIQDSSDDGTRRFNTISAFEKIRS